MEIETIYHSGLIVSDLDRSVKFYSEVLGLNVERQPTESSGQWISSVVGYEDVRIRLAFVGMGDGHSLELIQYLAPKGGQGPGAYERNDVGATHVGMIVDDAHAWYEHLRANGVSLFGPPALRDAEFPWARHALYFQDPDGHWLELVERAPRPEGAGGN